MRIEEIYKYLKERAKRFITDSREVKSGDVFFALKGDNFDGNSYAHKAIEDGALAAIIDNKEYSSEKTILVEDVLQTLQKLANIHRNSLNIPVLAITGTNGKTTTKELVSRVLSEKYLTHYTKGNLNNHIGLPLTILNASDKSEFIVLEMGANHIGEIKRLCEIAEPGVGLITNIGKAHLEGFGSFEGVIKAKTELYTFLDLTGGSIIYNDEDSLISDLARQKSCLRVSYSKPDSIIDIQPADSGQTISMSLIYRDKNYTVNSHLFGGHNVQNIKAAIAVGLYFGVSLDRIINAIENYIPENNRSQLLITSNNTLLCDAYNANPDSMLCALKSFSKDPHKYKTVILGDMLELGQYSMEEHKKIISFLLNHKDINALLVGENFSLAAKGYSIRSFADTAFLLDYLESNSIKDNFVLLKGSRGIALEKAFKLL